MAVGIPGLWAEDQRAFQGDVVAVDRVSWQPHKVAKHVVDAKQEAPRHSPVDPLPRYIGSTPTLASTDTQRSCAPPLEQRT